MEGLMEVCLIRYPPFSPIISERQMKFFPGLYGGPGPGPFEEDFVLELNQNGITLCAIEVSFRRPEATSVTLKYLASGSGGRFGEILHANGSDVSDQMRPVLTFVAERLNESPPLISEEYEIVSAHSLEISSTLYFPFHSKFQVYKEMFANFSKKLILIPKRPEMDVLHIYVSLVDARLQNITFQPSYGSTSFSERHEWIKDLEYNEIGRFSYSYAKTVNLSQLETVKPSQAIFIDPELRNRQAHAKYL